MRRAIVLDAGPLGFLTNPHGRGESILCFQWLQALLQGSENLVLIPEIADFEVRRELIRANLPASVQRLDALQHRLTYLPLTTAAMRQAAIFWAQARNRGVKTADDKALDVDMILAAQTELLRPLADAVLIATTNVGHVALFADARRWQDIPPQVS